MIFQIAAQIEPTLLDINGRLRKNEDQVTTRKENLEGKLVVEAYAAAIEPARHENFMEAWTSYLEHSLNGEDRGRLEMLNEESLYAHFHRAHKIFNSLENQVSLEKGASDLVNSVAGIGVLVAADGQVLARNKSAGALIGEAKNISQFALDETSIHQIKSWIGNTREKNAGFLFTPYFAEGGDGFLLTTEVDFNSDANSGEHSLQEKSERYFMISSVELQLSGEALKEVGKVFNLTVAESQVAGDLCNGKSPNDIAESRAVSIHTVRSQIKSIQQKTNSRTSLDLVRKLCAFASNLESKEPVSPARTVRRKLDSYRRSGSLILADGRRLSYSDQGDPAGRPILFFHNMSFGVEWTDAAIEASAKAGWRIIAPSRPGFGETDGHPTATGTDLLNLAATDAAQLLSHLSIKRVIVIGHVMGSIYAQHFALVNKDLCQGLLFVSHAPYWSDDVITKLPTRHRVLAQTTLQKPLALSLLLRAGAALINSGRAEVLIRALHNKIHSDKVALDDLEIYRVVQSGLQHAAVQGYQAFQKDCEIVTSDWLEESKKIQAGVTVIHGGGDRIVTPEHIESFANAVPNSKVVWVPGAGQYLLYSHWNTVLAQLEKMAASN